MPKNGSVINPSNAAADRSALPLGVSPSPLPLSIKARPHHGVLPPLPELSLIPRTLSPSPFVAGVRRSSPEPRHHAELEPGQPRAPSSLGRPPRLSSSLHKREPKVEGNPKHFEFIFEIMFELIYEFCELSL
jgi:hypothetical protein